MSFKDLKLIKPLLKAIDASGYTEPTLVQERTIPVILEGKDVIVSAQTGTGKTAAFTLPALHHVLSNKRADDATKSTSPRVLILTPTRELAQQVFETVKNRWCSAIHAAVCLRG
mgnify:CR=1 FL=1